MGAGSLWSPLSLLSPLIPLFPGKRGCRKDAFLHLLAPRGPVSARLRGGREAVAPAGAISVRDMPGSRGSCPPTGGVTARLRSACGQLHVWLPWAPARLGQPTYHRDRRLHVSVTAFGGHGLEWGGVEGSWRQGPVTSGQQAGSSTDLKEAHRIPPSWGIKKAEAGWGLELGGHLGS